MRLEVLLSDKKIEKVEKSEFSSLSAEKSVAFARKGLETENYDEIMSVVYNGVFRICNRLMNFLGYRAIGKEHHKNVFEFLRVIELNQDYINYFDNIRKRRNDFVYRDIESTTKDEAEKMISIAESFINNIKSFIKTISIREDVHKNRTDVHKNRTKK